MTEVVHVGTPEGILVTGGFMSPRTYFEEVVSPNVDLCLRDNGSKQFAFNAAVALYHMIEYVCGFATEHGLATFPFLGRDGIRAYRGELIIACPELGIAEAVALVYKHYRVDNVKARSIAPSIVSIQREGRFRGGNVDVSTYPPDQRPIWVMDYSKPYKIDERIIVEDSTGKIHVLHEVFTIVRDMWRREIGRLGMDGAVPGDLKTNR